jgi:hypothetical protein
MTGVGGGGVVEPTCDFINSISIQAWLRCEFNKKGRQVMLSIKLFSAIRLQCIASDITYVKNWNLQTIRTYGGCTLGYFFKYV